MKETIVVATRVSGSCVRGHVSDARARHHDAWAEPDLDGTYRIIAVKLGAEETGVRAEPTVGGSPAP